MNINDKHMEAIMYMLDNRPIMLERLSPRWGADRVEVAIDRIYDPIEDRKIPVPLSEVEKDVLRECVEGSIWLQPYVSGPSGQKHLDEARATLRDLARRFEGLGIEINHLPFE